MSDIVTMHSIECLGNELNQIRSQLEQYAYMDTPLSFNGRVIEADMLLEFYDYVMELSRRKLRQCQQRGIEEALKRKSEGLGSYGRPRTVLPDDFEEQVRWHLQKNISLSGYQERIKMKRSTFYKYARDIKGTLCHDNPKTLK